MTSHVLTLLLLCTAAAAHAASFNCAKAKSPVEKAICADQQLSALDDQLGSAYQVALSKAGEADLLVRQDQRTWLSNLTAQCGGTTITACIQQHENARIAQLRSTPAFNPASLTEYKLTNASQFVDFDIRLFAKPAQPGDDTREGPGRVLVFKKGDPHPLQTITMDNIFVSLDKTGHPLVNSAGLYDYQGVINTGDFNFDGNQDFAIQNGNNGAYAGPSYDVYLYSPADSLFHRNKPLTDLIEATLGFFGVDPAKKLLHTFAKDGCCYHESTFYTVVDNKPVPVSRTIEDAVKNQLIEQKMIDGKWKGTVKPLPPEDQAR